MSAPLVLYTLKDREGIFAKVKFEADGVEHVCVLTFESRDAAEKYVAAHLVGFPVTPVRLEGHLVEAS